MFVKFFYLAIVPAFWLAGCDYHPPDTGPVRTDTINIARGTADHANVELDLGAGELNLHGGSDQLIEGKFEYTSAYKPLVETKTMGSHTVVTVRQAGHGGWGGNSRNLWDLKLSDEAVLDLSLNCGAGQANMAIGDVKLRNLEVHMGAGQVDLDLRGNPTRDYDVHISGGVGQATIHLPQGIGLRADAHGGIGSIDITGLTKREDHYENDLYDKAKVNVRLKVEGGIGEIRIIG
jgi:hypothetical protein